MLPRFPYRFSGDCGTELTGLIRGVRHAAVPAEAGRRRLTSNKKEERFNEADTSWRSRRRQGDAGGDY
ncbi:hypothetical protein SDC9_206427 [bioreactor metagenome]|uniref:Uncharacterized protein n=1 Tax=bioreactor metagenome TaxID=1076179 RepID=A0A645J4T4_9ZZZZ